MRSVPKGLRTQALYAMFSVHTFLTGHLDELASFFSKDLLVSSDILGLKVPFIK